MAGDSWSQPNQQVVRDGEPVGIPNTDGEPDPQKAGKRRSHKAPAAPAHERPEGRSPDPSGRSEGEED